MLKIDLENTYEALDIAEDLSFMTLIIEDANAVGVLIKIQIKPLLDPLLPGVHNLSFGPLTEKGEIDDEARIEHKHPSKMFSTILLFSLGYLQVNADVTIGVDGSNDGRAYLYHRMFKTNEIYLEQYFVAIGVDWYVRLLRNGLIEKDIEGFAFFKPRPEPFDYKRNANDLYRYYMFRLK